MTLCVAQVPLRATAKRKRLKISAKGGCEKGSWTKSRSYLRFMVSASDSSSRLISRPKATGLSSGT